MYIHDLLLKGGRIVDPASDRSGTWDIGINGQTITAIAEDIPPASARTVIDARGRLVTAGFIDLHAHVADGVTRHGINPDRAGVFQGVTTIVDGGSLGPSTFVAMRRHVIPHSRTRILCFLNLSFAGQARMPELRTWDDLDEQMLETVLSTNRDLIRGIKVRCISPTLQNLGPDIFDIGARHADSIGGPVMLHIGDHGEGEGSARLTRQVLAKLRPNDILTHPYTSFPGGAFDQDGEVIEEIRAAVERGVVIDVGRGAKNFTISNARRAVDMGFLPTTISTDVTLMTIHGPVFGLADTASIFLNLGMTLEDVILRVTTNPAKALGIDGQLGTLEVGKHADLTVLDHIKEGTHHFHGYGDETMTGNQVLVPRLTVASGEPVDCDLPWGSAMAAADGL